MCLRDTIIKQPFEEHLLAKHDTGTGKIPFLTVAIPHYKRRRYLEVNLNSLFAQDFEDFEILVSDDKSPDDSNAIIPALLQASGCQFRYYAQPINLGYDGNVRFCLGAARGRYVMMLGNDDALVNPTTLSEIVARLKKLELPEVAVTNYQDWETHKVTRRAYGDRILGTGWKTAAHFFRSFSFTSGLVYDRAAAAQHETDKWDRSIYYQIFLACRIISAGGQLAGLDLSVVRDHIRLNGDLVPETYRNRYKNAPWSFKWKHTGLDSVIRVTADAVLPFVPSEQHSSAVRQIISQVLKITYPFWLFEYRALANWGYGFGIARDLWPRHLLAEYRLNIRDRCYLWCLYMIVTVIGLTVPAGLFNRVRYKLADIVRRRRQIMQGKIVADAP
jgi:glycosyltransferase involved in cell wall biosynthesis